MDFLKTIFYKKPLLSAFLILFVVGAVIYSNTLNAPFVLDDYVNIRDNPYVRMTEIEAEYFGKLTKFPSEYRPLPNLSFAFNYYFHRYDVSGYHIVNIAIHIINSFLVFLIFRQTLYWADRKNDLIAACAALLWLVNPVHIQSVTYIVQRMTSMCAMFYLLSLYAYIKARIDSQNAGIFTGKNIFLFTVSLFSFAAALLSKQIAATLPVFVLFYEWFFINNLRLEWIRKNIKWIGLVGIIIGIIGLYYLGGSPLERILSGYENRDFTLAERLLTQPRVVIFYLSLLFIPFPSRLTLEHDIEVSTGLFEPLTTFLSISIIVALLVAMVLVARNYRILSFSILWFFGHLVIESSFIPLELVFEHRTYLPSVFLFLALIYYLCSAARNHVKPAAAIFACLIVVFSGLTFARNHTWADSIRFHKDCLKKSPENPRVVYDMGAAYYNNKKYEKALKYCKKAINLKSDYARAYGTLGAAYYQLNKVQAAVRYLKKAIELNPGDIRNRLFLGSAYNYMNKMDMAIYHFEKIVKEFPDHVEARMNIGISYAKKEEYNEALSQFSKVIETHPEYYKAYNNIGNCLMEMNKKEKAVKYYKQAIKYNPKSERAHANLGSIYLNEGKFSKAEEYFLKALHANPESFEILTAVADMYFQQKKYAKAKKYYKKATDLHDAKPYPNLRLGIINLQTGDYENSREYFNNALNKGADKSLVHYYLGLCELPENNYQKSIASFEKSLELNPGFMKAKRKLADTYMAGEDYDKALDLYNDILSRAPADVQCLKQAARIHLEKKQYEKALSRFEAAYQADSKDASVIQNLAFLYARFERYGKASSKFEELKKFRQKNPLLHYNLACMYSETGSKKAALENLELALEYGYDNKSKLMQDPNLEFVRKTDEFKALVQNLPQ